MIGIYARVSTEEQSKKGYSLKDQVKSCREKAKSIDIKEYIDDGISGEILERPGLSRLREDVRKGIIKKVICLDPDRLSRKLINQLIITEEFDKKGIELIFVNGEYSKTPEGNLFYSLRGAVSEFEKAKINERMSRGRKEKARQGKVLRDFQIYGYDYDKKIEQLIINEEEARVVRLIFDLFTKPNDLVEGINGIAQYLTKQGIKTKRGARVWHRQVVRQLLMNPVYIGEFYQNKWNTEGMLGNSHRAPEDRVPMRQRSKEEWIKIPCPSIIDQVTFYHAQRLLKESRRRWAKKGKNKYLLSGLLRCGDCGNTMTGRKAKNWGKYVFEYTDRKSYSGAKHPGCGRTVRCGDLDHYVWDRLATWLNDPEEISNLSNSEMDNLSLEETEIKRIEKEIERTKKGIKKLLRLFATGDDEVFTEDEIRSEIKELKDQEIKLKNQLEKLEKQKKEEEKLQYTSEIIREAADFYLKKGQQELTFEDKQELIRQVVREIIVFENRIEIHTF